MIFVMFFLVVILFLFVKHTELLSTSGLVSTPKWKYINGCSGGSCATSAYNLGELILSSGAPLYLKDLEECRFNHNGQEQIDETEWEAYPSPSKECWVQNFTFDGDEFSIKAEKTIPLNDYIEVTWKPSGQIHHGDVCHKRWGEDKDGNKIQLPDECHFVNYSYDWQDPEWKNEFTFNVYDLSFFVTTIRDKHLADTLLEDSFVSYDIYNDLTKIEGGSIVKEKHKLWSPANSEKTNYFNIYKGERRYLTSISSDTLGDANIFIKPFMIVYNDIMGSKSPVYLYSNSDEKELRILPNIENIQQDIDFWKRNAIQPNITADLEEEEPKELSPLTIILIAFVVGGLIYLVIKK